MTQNRFELAVFDPIQESAISCYDYLTRRDGGTLSWLPSDDDSTIFLSVDGEEWLADEWNLGDLRLIVQQLEDVLPRLQRGESAILRSAVLDQPQAPYLLFEPSDNSAQDIIRISLFLIADAAAGRLFPIKYWSDSEPEKLFEYVEQNREKLLESDPWSRPGSRRLKELPFPRAELMNALSRELDLGQRVVELLEQNQD